MHPRILAVVPAMREDVRKILRSLLGQTVAPERVIVAVGSRNLEKFLARNLPLEGWSRKVEVVYVRPDLKEHVGVRVAKAINRALEQVNLHLYDYLLKVDADVLMPHDYVERCLSLGADLVGLGPFMLVRMKPFLRLLGGRWPEVPADDAYVAMRFRAAGLKVAPWPQRLPVSKTGGNWRYYYYRGFTDFEVGFDPLREAYAVALLVLRRRTLLPAFTLLGYFCALLSGAKMRDFGRINFSEGLKRSAKGIAGLLKRRSRSL